MALNLSKGQKTVVKKSSGQAVTNLTVGVSWAKINRLGNLPVSEKGFLGRMFSKASNSAAKATGQLEDVDLDLTIATFDASGNAVGECAFYAKTLFDGAIVHSGDDRGGDDEDDGLDNERIKFQGLKVATQTSVQSAFIILNSYSHQKFDEIPHIRLAIYDGLFGLTDKAPRLLEFDLKNDKSFNGAEAVILARLDKTAGGWELTAIGQPTSDQSIRAIVSRIKSEHL